VTWVLAAAGATIALTDAAALAGKPSGGGGGGGGTVDGGTVWFQVRGASTTVLSTMNPDGSGKAAVLSGPSFGASWSPSRSSHGGHRWVLQCRTIAGQTYADGTTPRREWFAVRDDGLAERQLTAQTDLCAVDEAAWAPGDSAISWTARKWQSGAFSGVDLYVATVTYDAAGDVVGLAAQPATPAVDLASDVGGHDWSPDGSRVVVSDGAHALWVADLVSGAVSQLTRLVKRKPTAVLGRDPAWSPDGSRIAHSEAGEIRIAAVDGSSLTTVATTEGGAAICGEPRWSPLGSDLVYLRIAPPSSLSSRMDVFRVAAAGGTPVNLTAELDTRSEPNGGVGGASPTAWR
jgi:hypothetical protein